MSCECGTSFKSFERCRLRTKRRRDNGLFQVYATGRNSLIPPFWNGAARSSLLRPYLDRHYSCSCGAAEAVGMVAEMQPSMNSTLHCQEDAASLTRLITSADFTVLGEISTST